LFDIDDTITTEGKLTADAYQSIWDLSDAGLKVVPITGRPAGWCVYPAGSAHRPTVSGGRALVLYLLPAGQIEFTRA